MTFEKKKNAHFFSATYGQLFTLDLLALIPFKLQHSQLVSLWKSSHSGYKKWYCHFYTCQINKGDIWLQFENNEKNPPGGAVIQKNQKQILKSWYLHYWRAPRGARGVKISERPNWSPFWWVGALRFSQNWRNCEKPSELNNNYQRNPVFWRFFKFYSIWAES